MFGLNHHGDFFVGPGQVGVQFKTVTLGPGDTDTALGLITSIREYAMRTMRYEVFAWADAALGFVGGSTGETCGVLILLGGAYLAARNMMSWQIPTAILTTVFLLSGALYLLDSEAFPDPLFMLFFKPLGSGLRHVLRSAGVPFAARLASATRARASAASS